MQNPQAFADIGHIIQLSVAPVFLLVAVGSMLNVMTARLGRVVDRARKIEEDIGGGEMTELRALRIEELKALDRRMIYSNWAINMCAISALFVAFVVVLLFVSDIVSFDLSLAVAMLFVLAMLGIIGGLCLFLLEIAASMRTVRVRAEILKGK